MKVLTGNNNLNCHIFRPNTALDSLRENCDLQNMGKWALTRFAEKAPTGATTDRSRLKIKWFLSAFGADHYSAAGYHPALTSCYGAYSARAASDKIAHTKNMDS